MQGIFLFVGKIEVDYFHVDCKGISHLLERPLVQRPLTGVQDTSPSFVQSF